MTVHDDTPLSLPEAAEYLWPGKNRERTFRSWVSDSKIWQSAFYPINENEPEGKRYTTPARLRKAMDELGEAGKKKAVMIDLRTFKIAKIAA